MCHGCWAVLLHVLPTRFACSGLGGFGFTVSRSSLRSFWVAIALGVVGAVVAVVVVVVAAAVAVAVEVEVVVL